MKGKGKQKNTFRFQNFAERISNIKINLYSQPGDNFHGIPEDDKDTFFRETLEQLAEINCSLDFISLYKELKQYVRSFNLLLFHKNKIIDLLKQNLLVEGSNASKACLQLLGALARDLSSDFYPVFEDIFSVLVQLLKRRDAELIEDTFICLAFIFKCTWRYMVNDISKLFHNFKCLLASEEKVHIQCFAAESLAFLIQKSKQQKDVIHHLFAEVSKEPTLAVGVGRLIFQTVKGIKNQFAFSAIEILNICLELFYSDVINGDQVFIALETTWASSLKHSSKEYSQLFFDSLYSAITECMSRERQKCLSYYIRLLNVAVSYRNGQFVSDQAKLFEVLNQCFSWPKLTDENVDMLIILLKSSYLICNIEVADTEIIQAFHSFLAHESIHLQSKLDFCRSLFPWAYFKTYLNSACLDFVSKCLLAYKNDDGNKLEWKAILLFMVDLVYKDIRIDEPFFSQIDNSSMIQLPVESSSNVIIRDMLLAQLNIQSWENNADFIWTSVTCLCHCKFEEDSKITRSLFAKAKSGLLIASEENFPTDMLFGLSHCIMGIFLLEKRSNVILELLHVADMMQLIRKFPSSEDLLQCFEAYCCCLGDSVVAFGEELVVELYELLKVNIYSPHKMICLTTLKIFKHLSEHFAYIGCKDEAIDIFQLCIDAIQIDVTINKYQERLLIMRKLEWNEKMSPLQQDAAVRFLIGSLFVNFSLLWETIYELISSHANSDKFWQIWEEVLEFSIQNCENGSSDFYHPILSSVDEHIKYSACEKNSQLRVDYQNFRLLLWKSMTRFSEFTEKRAKYVISLFLRFMRNEYCLIDEMIAKKQDLSVKSNMQLANAKEENIKGRGKAELKALCAHLSVFSTFKKPKIFDKESKFYNWYLDFLTSKDKEIQNLAINCLMSYNLPFMVPYKGNFEKLMDDSNFRDELMHFSQPSEEDAEGIKHEHIDELLPILIRLLYGKLQRRSGLGVSGKSSVFARQNIIIQFLMNCSCEQIQPFFNLILEPFEMLEDIAIPTSHVDVTCVVPLRKQIGFLNMFSNVMTRLALKAKPYLSMMFNTLIKLTWICFQCLATEEQVHSSYIGRLKDVRRLCLTKLNEFFEIQTDFPYEKYVEEIFYAAVWPQIHQFIADSIQNITPLLKLICTWSKHAEYHFLLSKEDKDGVTLLTCLFKILQQKSLSPTVENLIMMVSSNLLNVESFREKEKIVIDSVRCSKSYGSHLIQPFIGTILKHISDKISLKVNEIDVKKKQKMKKIIPKVQFSLLSHLSEFVMDADHCRLIVDILFPLLQCIEAEHTQYHMIITVKNMLPQLALKDCYLHFLPPLFSTVHVRKSREALCDIYLEITKDNADLTYIGKLVKQMNAWDQSRLDEPDYDKRLESFREISKCLNTGEWSCDQISPVLHNCLHFLLMSEDLSLRNAASSCIEDIINLVERKMSNLFTGIVLKILFPAVKHGLKSKKEEVRSEFLTLLGLLVETFDHSALQDMKCLSCQDAEKDFFKNFIHIQIHRKIRAIRQLSACCEEGKISASNLFSIMLPLISPIIFSKLAASKDHNLLTETISAIGCIMKHLPWNKYVHVMKNYIKALPKDKKNQKNITRVLMSILNNFHFDLSPLDVSAMKVAAHEENVGHPGKNEDRESHIGKGEDMKESKQCCQSESINPLKKIYMALTDKIIPQLSKFLKKKVFAGDFDKSNHKEKDDEEILKVPVEYALVQLLQRLPKASLHQNLPGVLLRISQSLRSHSKEVRDIARDTMKRIALSLGASYFPMIMKEMQSVLVRGYQLHVLGFTIHSILDHMKDILNAGDLDDCVDNIMEIAVNELVGSVGEEKEVSALVNKLYETRHRKSYDLAEIVAKYISNSSIGKVIGPLKEVLSSSQNHSSIHKVEEALVRIGYGLQSNSSLGDEDLLILVHGIVSDGLTNMICSNEKEEFTIKNNNNTNTAGENDCYLVPEAPKRGGVTPLLNIKTNHYVLIGFGLKLLHTSLKRQRFSESNSNHVKMLDPMIPVILSNMSSSYNEIITLSVKILSFLVKFSLPSIESHSSALGKNLFRILKTFTQARATKGKNLELISSSFKAMTILIREYKMFKITDKQLQILLTLVEEDIHNPQITSLPLLKAILSRKLTALQNHCIIKKISDLSVSDTDGIIRLQCRKIILQYLLDYPIGKKIVDHFDFYLSHLSYEEESGRISSLEMLTLILNNLHESVISQYAGYMFLPLVMMLINDVSSPCKRMCASTIKLLLLKINNAKINEMFDIVMKFADDEKPSLQHASIQLIGLFVEVEKTKFHRRVETCLPYVIKRLKACSERCNEDDTMNDKLLYYSLNCLMRIYSESNLLQVNEKYVEKLIGICDSCQDHLLHSHGWIRLATSQLFSLYFSSFTPVEWIKLSSLSEELCWQAEMNNKITKLFFLFIAQLKDQNLTKEISDQATKNLIYISRVIQILDPLTNPSIEVNQEINGYHSYKDKVNDRCDGEPITMKRMINKICQIARYEASQHPNQTLKRTCVFRLIASLTMDLGELFLKDYLVDLLQPIHRETCLSANEDSPLYMLSREVLELMREVVKKDVFADAYFKLQKHISSKKEDRKRKQLTEAVAKPSEVAMRKQKKNLAKRDQRKRKLNEKKPLLKFKKIKSTPDG